MDSIVSLMVQGSYPSIVNKQGILPFPIQFLQGPKSFPARVRAKSRMFSIVGDSNVVDNMTSFNTASREVMKSAQVIPCPVLNKIPEAFQVIRFVVFTRFISLPLIILSCIRQNSVLARRIKMLQIYIFVAVLGIIRFISL